ncbi:MAG: GtrA family protein [Armatimonadota bacterium]|nr:GtrA family protein [Armatimonadota bacterium]
MIAPQNETPKATALNQIAQKPGVRQFVKFGIVGASSSVINFGLSNLFHYKLGWPLVPALTIAFFLSVLNGFFWNRQWTFKEARGKPAHTQSLQFLAVNIVGWLLNTSIVVLIILSYKSHGHGLFSNPEEARRIVIAMFTNTGKQEYGPLLFNGALLAATAVVVFWNFFANRFWTFKH